jgi:hypothetical protein
MAAGAKVLGIFAILSLLLLAKPVVASEWVIVDQFPSPAGSAACGLAWDGTCLWHIASYYGWARFYCIAVPTGTVLRYFDVNTGTSTYFEDISYGEGRLYAHRAGASVQNEIWVIEPATGSVVEQRAYHVGISGQGLEYDPDRQALWAVQGKDGSGYTVSNINLVQGASVVQTVVNDTLIAEGNPPDGLGYADDVLYTVNNAAEIFLIDVNTQRILDRFQGPGGVGMGPEGMTWDGAFLWYADASDQMIYKMALISPNDLRLDLSPVTNCINLLGSGENNQQKLRCATLTAGTEYRVTVAGQAFKDGGNTPMVGVLLEYTDSTGLRDRLLPAHESFVFTCQTNEANDFKAYLVDSNPQDNEGQFSVLIEPIVPTGIMETQPGHTPGAAAIAILSLAPNPFNPSVEISLESRMSGPVTMEIYDVSGRLVRAVSLGVLGLGLHRASWDGRDLSGARVSSGVYLIRLRNPTEESQAVKAVLIR